MATIAFGVGLAASTGGCAAASQNIKGQELSFRGAWFCEKGSCAPSLMVKSRAGARKDSIFYNRVTFAGRVAMAVTSAKPFDELQASVRDCKGHQTALTEDKILRPGDHEIGDETTRASWIIMVDPRSLETRGIEFEGSCSRWVLTARAHWKADDRFYSLDAGLTTE